MAATIVLCGFFLMWVNLFQNLPISRQELMFPKGMFMNISNSPAVQAASSATQSETADSVNILVLKKAMDMQATTAMTLLQALPQPALATQGTLGTRINAFAWEFPEVSGVRPQPLPIATFEPKLAPSPNLLSPETHTRSQKW